MAVRLCILLLLAVMEKDNRTLSQLNIFKMLLNACPNLDARDVEGKTFENYLFGNLFLLKFKSNQGKDITDYIRESNLSDRIKHELNVKIFAKLEEERIIESNNKKRKYKSNKQR